MNKLILHQLYAHSAFDLSNNRNHGIPMNVVSALSPDAPSFLFNNPNSEVKINPSLSLTNLWAIRSIITFKLETNPPFNHRFNLMEGHLSFSLFIGSDGSLNGTILDKNGNWTGANSVANLVKSQVWHRAELQYDGINQVKVLLDGVLVASAYNVLGPIKPVGPHGLAIGHWPEAPGVYTFQGAIREIWLYKYDPQSDANSLLDPCCMDKKVISEIINELKTKKVSSQDLKAKGSEILQFAIDLMAEVRGNDAATTHNQENLSKLARAAFEKGDQATYNQVSAQLAQLTQSRLTASQLKDINQKEQDLVKSLPLPIDELKKLIPAYCWNKVGLDPNQLVMAIDHLKKIHSKGIQ